MIHIIGDSHTNIFRDNKNQAWVAKDIGAPTAYNLWNNQAFWNYVAKIDLSDKLIIMAGEIDCRIHIYHHAKEDKISMHESVLETILHYDRTLSKLRNHSPHSDFIVCNVVPAGCWQGDIVDGKYHLTPIKQRIQIHKMFHDMFRVWCREKEYPLIDIWDKVIDGNHTRSNLRCDEVHLCTPALPIYMEEFKRLRLDI